MYSSIVRAGMAKNMLQEVVWFEHPRVENSERLYQEIIAKRHSGLEVVVSVPHNNIVYCRQLQGLGLSGISCSQPKYVREVF